MMERDAPEVVFASSDPTVSRAIGRGLRAGELRKIAPRLYTTNLQDPPETIVRRNLYPILAGLYPGSILSHRTALEGGPTRDGTVFMTYRYARKIELPGLCVRLLSGPGRDAADTPFLGSLYMASEARAYLENMQPSRRRGTAPKCLPRARLEKRLDRLCRLRGEEALNRLRDRAREVAGRLGMVSELEKLEGMIGAILGSRPSAGLETSLARARSTGEPYDPDRLELFQSLFAHLRSCELVARPESPAGTEERAHLAFFEAYFSNFIEGTQFDLETARQIVFQGKVPDRRPADSHDILGTFRLVADPVDRSLITGDPDEFLRLLRSRHATIMAGRPESAPGELKTLPNRAGGTLFVLPELVRGTLRLGFELARSLPHPLARAIYLMVLVAEVHPFADGNGRVSRVVLNAELTAGGLARALIPTVLREDLLLALRALSRSARPEPILRVVDRSQALATRIDFSTFDGARAMLEARGAFQEPPDGRLVLPIPAVEPPPWSRGE